MENQKVHIGELHPSQIEENKTEEPTRQVNKPLFVMEHVQTRRKEKGEKRRRQKGGGSVVCFKGSWLPGESWEGVKGGKDKRITKKVWV